MAVLWLASWYPGRTNATNGDFIERMAHAVAQKLPVVLLFVTKDENLKPGAEQMEKTVSGNLTVYKVYYGSQRFGGGWLEKWLSVKKYLALQKKYYAIIAKAIGQPKLVHVHVAMKAGLLALWLLKKYGIPYLLTEHWTGYYPHSSPSLYQQNILYRWLNKKVVQKASAFLPVSDDLGQTVNKYLVEKEFQSVPNVVDTQLFFYKATTQPLFRFIHPSYLNEQKNPMGMLRACKMAVDAGASFELWLVGGQDAQLEHVADEMGLLNSTVFFKPPVSYADVAALMQQSSALLLFSRFENLPCVILEALCCGLPVISSRVGGIPEIIDHNNGLLVPEGDEAALAKSMLEMMHNYQSYNRSSIAANAQARFGYETVAQQIINVYQNTSSHL